MAKLLLWLGALLALYALLGFVGVPALVERQGPEFLTQRLGVPAAIGKVRFNPFNFKIEANDLRVGPPERPLVSAQRLFVDLELSSLFQRAWTFADVQLDGPDVQAEIAPDGRLNLAQLAPRSEPAQPPGALPNLVLRHAAVLNGRIAFTDRRRSEPATATLMPLDIELVDIATLPDRDGHYSVTAALPDRARLSWRGTLSLRPLESAGEVELTGLQAGTLWPFVRDFVRLKTPVGTLGVSTRYTIASADGRLALKLEDAALHVAGLSLTALDSDVPLLKLDALDATQGRIDIGTQEFSLAQLQLRNATVAVPLGRDGAADWGRVLSAAPARPASGAAAKASTPAASAPAWRGRIDNVGVQRIVLAGVDGSEAPIALDAISLRQAALDVGRKTVSIDEAALRGGQVQAVRNADGQFVLSRLLGAGAQPRADTAAPSPDSTWNYKLAALGAENLRLAFRDRSFSPALAYDVQLANATLKNIASSGSAPLTFDARFTTQGGGTLAASGNFASAERRGEGRIDLAGLQLLPLQPLIARHAALALKSGSLSADARLRFDGQGEGLRVEATGELGLADLLVNESLSGDRFLSFKQLKASRVKFESAPARLSIGEIDVLQPGAKLVISKDRQVNLTQVMKPQPAQTPRAPDASKTPDTSKTADAGKTANAETETAAERSLPVRIARVRLRQGVLDYADLSLVLPFSTRITGLNGTVVGISSQRARRAQVQASGEIPPFGSASVEGGLVPFDPTQFLDLLVRMNNVEMPPLSPYTATFAGRKIAAGKLWLELNYKIVDRQLLGDNKVRLADFALGERVEAPNALDLPLDLAVGLLTDSQGRIDIAVPVRGDVGNPRFELGTVIREALGNVLRQIISAPFRALGALFGGGGAERAAKIEFEPGSEQLTPPEREKLTQVAAALAQRPQLKLLVRGPYAAERDVRALRDKQMRAELAKALGEELASGAAPAPLDFASRRTGRAIEDLLKKYGGDAVREFEPRIREVQANTLPDRSEARRQLYGAIFDRIVANYPLPEDAGQQLATRRAEAIRDYLVSTTKTPAERVEAGPVQAVSGGGESGSASISTALELSASKAPAS